MADHHTTLQSINQLMLSLTYFSHLEPQVNILPQMTSGRDYHYYDFLFIIFCFFRGAKSNSLDSTFTNTKCCWWMGFHWCSTWRCVLLAYKFRMGDGTNSNIFMFSIWCNSCSLPWFSSWPWFWKICSGGSSNHNISLPI